MILPHYPSLESRLCARDELFHLHFVTWENHRLARKCSPSRDVSSAPKANMKVFAQAVFTAWRQVLQPSVCLSQLLPLKNPPFYEKAILFAARAPECHIKARFRERPAVPPTPPPPPGLGARRKKTQSNGARSPHPRAWADDFCFE